MPFIQASAVRIASNGDQTDGADFLESIANYCNLEGFRDSQPARNHRIHFYDGPVYLVDWAGTQEGLKAEPLTIPVRRSTYFQAMLAHEGLHPAIARWCDDRLSKLHEPIVSNLNELRNHITQFQERTNPLRRPAPLGLSVSILGTLRGETALLVSQRSDHVAINPGVYTTSIDEGVHTVSNSFPWSILIPAFTDELGTNGLTQTYIKSELACHGFHYPSPDAEGVKAGANIIYSLRLPPDQDLEELARSATNTSESEVTTFMTFEQIKKLPRDKASPALLISTDILQKKEL
jgi:hypothetical protein